MTKYQVVNFKTRELVGQPFKSRGRARRRADKLDLEYGAISYIVKPVEVSDNG